MKDNKIPSPFSIPFTRISYLFYYCLSLSVHLEVMPCPVAAKSVC